MSRRAAGVHALASRVPGTGFRGPHAKHLLWVDVALGPVLGSRALFSSSSPFILPGIPSFFFFSAQARLSGDDIANDDRVLHQHDAEEERAAGGQGVEEPVLPRLL